MREQLSVDDLRPVLVRIKRLVRSERSEKLGASESHHVVVADSDDIAAGLRAVVDVVRRVAQPTGTSIALATELDATLTRKLKGFLVDLAGTFQREIPARLGARKHEVLRQYLAIQAPSVLDIFNKSRDENAHSDVIRWLLDPNDAPTIAPAALHKLAEQLDEPDVWQKLLRTAVAENCLSVRREVVLKDEGGEPDNRDRIDLLITGPAFVLAIENKIESQEHEGQTKAYWTWLQRRSHLRTAGLFLTPTGFAAQCPEFKSISYLTLLSCLLEGPLQGGVKGREGVVLAGYLKTLADHVLEFELRALARDLIVGGRA